MNKSKKISVFGLGKLGVPLIATFLSKGFKVIGVDRDIKKINSLKKLKSPVYEKDVQKLLNKYGKNLEVTSKGQKAIKGSDITFVIVATPSLKDGGFSNKYVLDACKVIGKALKEKKSYHLVSITSTVMPGSMDKVIKPCLEKYSKKIAGKDFGLCYNPEFIALGTVIEDFLNPDFVLIGQSDKKAGNFLSKFYKKICKNNPPIQRMNFISAELAKLALNSFITTKISFANGLARICEKIQDTDVDIITDAIGCDERIGKKYLSGAISYGGPCFPRDNLALVTLCKKLNVPFNISNATHNFNKAQVKWLANFVNSKVEGNKNVSILGITYKVGSDVVEESPGLLLAKELLKNKLSLYIYDPIGLKNAKRVLVNKVKYVSNLAECIKKSNVIVITLPDKKYKSIPLSKLGSKHAKNVVIDCWRILRNVKNKKNIEYIPLGIGNKKYER